MGKPRLADKHRHSTTSRAQEADPAFTLDQVRCFWAENQGIFVRVAESPSEIIRRTGWIYSSGGAGPYLAMRARKPGCARAEVDRAVFAQENLVELQAVRGCTMLVPAEDAALALYSAQSAFEPNLTKATTVLKISPGEVRDLTSAVLTVLKTGPLPSEQLREILPKTLVRPLGAIGRKFGESWNLNVVLKKMQIEGAIQRIARDGRLDGSRYCYRLSTGKPARQLCRDEAWQHLARRFFQWAGPATIKEFAWWAQISQKEASNLVSQIGLRKILVKDAPSEALIFPEQLESLRDTDPARHRETVSLLPFRDNFLYFRRGLGPFLRGDDAAIRELDFHNMPVQLSAQDHLHHNSILQGGLLTGAWEFDPDEGRIIWKTWTEPSARLRKSITARIEELEQFIREELGDAAFYAFDRGAGRRERIDSLR
jgi:hypothetical protein